MTTFWSLEMVGYHLVVEAYRLDRYDNFREQDLPLCRQVVEAYRLDRYDN